MYNKLLAANLILIILTSFSIVRGENNKTFPEGFLFGVSTSAYQVEGAWDRDGKGENIWDRWIHDDPSRIRNNDTADVACNSYDQTRMILDVLYANSLNVSHYRFSISWSRLLPNGTSGPLNAKGIMYYQDLIDYIDMFDMIPVATLYYYDLPQPLQDLGGWTNPDMVNYFAEYAQIAFQYFPKVQYWITFNDPRAICRQGYGDGTLAPGISLDGTDEYLCSYIILKSHAAAYHLYKESFPNLKAKVSIALDIEWSEPASNSPSDIEAAERRNLFEFGLYGHPVFIGNWPQVVIDRVGNRSKNENLEKSRLPQFNQTEIDYIKGTADFMAINTYTTFLVSDAVEAEYGDPGYVKDMKVNAFLDPSWNVAPNGKAVAPWGARKALTWLKNTYNDSLIFITENGVSDNENYYDYDRIYFYTDYLLAILDAIYEDGVKVFGYTAKSLIDEFEWTDGYSQRYGFYEITFSNSDKTRLPRLSSYFYKDLATSLRIPDEAYTTSQKPITPTTTKPGGGGANSIALYPVLILVITYLCLVLT